MNSSKGFYRIDDAGLIRPYEPSKLATAPSAPPKRRSCRRIALGFAFLNIAGLAIVGLNVVRPLRRGVKVATATNAAPPAKFAPKPETTYAPGQAFRLGPYTYTITGHRTVTALDGQFSPVQAARGDEFLIVTFSIRNNSRRPRVVSTEAFKLRDVNGALYAACSQGAAAPRTALTKGDLLLTEIEPGVTKALAVAFEVPVGSLKPPVKLLLFERDLSGGHEATVYLR